MPGLISMSHNELTRLEILQRIQDRRLSQTQAAAMLSITDRQMRRLVRRYRDAMLSMIADQSKATPPERRSLKGPTRRYPSPARLV
jgi:transposase-like protein